MFSSFAKTSEGFCAVLCLYVLYIPKCVEVGNFYKIMNMELLVPSAQRTMSPPQITHPFFFVCWSLVSVVLVEVLVSSLVLVKYTPHTTSNLEGIRGKISQKQLLIFLPVLSWLMKIVFRLFDMWKQWWVCMRTQEWCTFHGMPHHPSADMLPRYRTTRCSKSAWQVVSGSMPPSLTAISSNDKRAE